MELAIEILKIKAIVKAQKGKCTQCGKKPTLWQLKELPSLGITVAICSSH